jgi:hypothetical protein
MGGREFGNSSPLSVAETIGFLSAAKQEKSGDKSPHSKTTGRKVETRTPRLWKAATGRRTPKLTESLLPPFAPRKWRKNHATFAERKATILPFRNSNYFALSNGRSSMLR